MPPALMWSEVYRPKRVEQMVGNEDVRLAVLKWLQKWVSGTKPLLLLGPPGVGKTTLVHAIATQFGFDLVEMNASDTRNRDSLQARLAPVMNNVSLFGTKSLLFLDEVDGISGREDTGGLDLLIDMMKEPTVPVIMAANVKSAKIKELAKACKTVEFAPVPPRLLLMFLEHVLASEGEKLGPGDKVALVNNCRGDIRNLLNSAQSRAAGYATVSNADVAEIEIQDAINGYFSATSKEKAVQLLARADASFPDPRYQGMDPESRRKDMIAALFSTIVSSQAGDTLADMLDVLSKADVVVGRVGRRRQWSLLRYVSPMLAHGLYDKSRGKEIRYSQYSMPWPVMGPVFARSQTVRKLASFIGPATHVSKRTCSWLVLPYLVREMINEKVDPAEFALANFDDESVGESLVKEIERAKGAKK
ncbi:AAA family ATPase [Nitrososphaera sp.]|uniref:AAA family ATPase n=1 Tax=Nitrososphaera sp. TaxID=1971748 RepID=UPI0017A75C54|nr:AAA family ATPase [Nitrososphaera sp.]NWG37078.1 AAA family ATPase [Nitrososphaera sp.]